MSALATSDLVAALLMGPGTTSGGSTGATFDGVSPGWKRTPESCCASGEEAGVEGRLPREPDGAVRAPFVGIPELARFGRSRIVEWGDGVRVERDCEDR